MVSLCIVRLTYLLLGWIGSLCAVAFLLGLALVAIVAVVWCGLNPFFTFYESMSGLFYSSQLVITQRVIGGRVL